jgi:hypothetical protein
MRPPRGEYSKLLQAAVGGFPKVLINIDALDECPVTEGARDTLLAETQKLQLRAYLLVASRDIPNIGRELKGVYHLEIRASGEDIKRYLMERISSSGDLMGHIKEDPKLYDDIISTLVDRAQGMYVYHYVALTKHSFEYLLTNS